FHVWPYCPVRVQPSKGAEKDLPGTTPPSRAEIERPNSLGTPRPLEYSFPPTRTSLKHVRLTRSRLPLSSASVPAEIPSRRALTCDPRTTTSTPPPLPRCATSGPDGARGFAGGRGAGSLGSGEFL